MLRAVARQTDEEFRNEQTLATMQSANEAAKRAEEAHAARGGDPAGAG